jgi:hypothetical protein
MIATAKTTQRPSYQETAMQAYFLWEKQGRPWGEEDAFWFEAERILGERLAAKQWRDEEEKNAVAKKVAATVRPTSSRSRTRAATKQPASATKATGKAGAAKKKTAAGETTSKAVGTTPTKAKATRKKVTKPGARTRTKS